MFRIASIVVGWLGPCGGIYVGRGQAKYLGVTPVSGKAVDPDQKRFPIHCFLSMGSSWALFFTDPVLQICLTWKSRRLSRMKAMRGLTDVAVMVLAGFMLII